MLIKNFYIKTWGCQMNIYDSFKIIQRMIYKKYILVSNPLLADILILNTCSIREKAQEKLFDQLGRFYKLFIKHKYKKNIIFAVGGCVASKDSKIILQRMPFINIIFSPKTLHKLPYLINLYIKYKYPIIYLNNPKKKYLSKFIYLPIKNYQFSLSAFITIMEGCNKFCSYCVVPYTRGKEISRPVNDILYEIKKLVLEGVKEIILLGQNVNAYKGIININNKIKIYNFAKLLNIIINNYPNIQRIRFISSHPIEFSNDIINQYKHYKIANLLHLPIQSGSNRILEKMNRQYTVEQYIEIINSLKNIRPNINISSDFIVGYPEEIENDIKQTINIINLINFDKSYSFIYSPRSNTPASNIINILSLEEKKKRLKLIQSNLNNILHKINLNMINSYQSVLITSNYMNNTNILIGITDNNRKVLIKGKNDLIGKLLTVKILTYQKNFFIGKLK